MGLAMAFSAMLRELRRIAPIALALGLPACAARPSLRVAERQLSFERPAPLVGPRTQADAIRTDDADVTLWVRFAAVAGPHTVRVRWIDPLGRLALDSGPLPLNGEGGYRELAGLTSTLPIRQAPAGLLPGAWRARVEVDGALLVDQRFTIEDSG